MIKKIITLLALVFCLGARAQTNVYHPFPSIYGDWGVFETVFPPAGSMFGITHYLQYVYYTAGDTIINTLNYKKVNYINEGAYTGVATPLNQIFTGGTYNFAYRNDSINKKVYIVPNDSLHELLWYNFNLNIGDTLKGTYSTVYKYASISPFDAMKVDSIDSIAVCGNYHKRYVCNCLDTYSYSQVYLIEGMGFTSNFISTCLSDNCAFEPGIIDNTNAWSVDACPNALGIKSNKPFETMVQVFPNPANTILNVELRMQNESTDMTITDMLGNKVRQVPFNTQHLTLNIADLSEGIYNISISSSEGVVNKRVVIVK